MMAVPGCLDPMNAPVPTPVPETGGGRGSGAGIKRIGHRHDGDARLHRRAGPARPLRGPGASWAPGGAKRPDRRRLAWAGGLALAGLLAAAPAAALEPRYDHRDEMGLLLEGSGSWDAVTLGDRSESLWRRPTLRAAFTFDLSGEGDELVLGGAWSGGAATEARVRWALDARYRGYFGSDEFKTFFEVGLWAPVSPRLAAGPRAGLGAAWDFSRRLGIFLAFGFATAFGEFRGASLDMGAGVQVRWP